MINFDRMLTNSRQHPQHDNEFRKCEKSCWEMLCSASKRTGIVNI